METTGMQPERQIVELTKELIRIPSTHTRPKEISRCADFIEAWLSRHHIKFRRFDIKGTPSFTVLPENQNVNVLLMAHFDVVEAEDERLFEPIEKEGRLYGRGAVDDKYAVATAMVLFANHLERLRADGKDQADMVFGLLLTGDEEVGGFDGAAPAIDHLDTEYFIALDGGNPGLIVTKEKGILQIDLTAHGKAAHAARPWLGENAFDILVKDYLAIQALFDTKTPDHWHKTMVLSNCRTGDGSVNKVPGSATAVLDIRYTEDDSPDALIADIEAAVTAEVHVKAKEPLFIGGPSPYLDLLVTHSGAAVGFEHGASDARFLSTRGIPGAVWGADGEMSQHAADEHVVISSMERIYACLDHYFTAIEKW
jgi:succinyl-diaminopimelate desuccinylase